MANKARIAEDIAAIWIGDYDYAPFYDPINNLGRVKFHSNLDYTQIIRRVSLTLSLPARTSSFQCAQQKYSLFQHGRGGYPKIKGIITVNGQPTDFAGSIPVQINNDGLNPSFWPQGFARWLTLGADNVWVYAYEYAPNYWSNSSSYGSYPAINVPFTVLVTNEMLG